MAVGQAFARDPMFAQDEAGNPIVRERCCECGRRFAQRLLSERFMTIVEHQGPGAVGWMGRELPELYVPKHCPPCERRDLGFAARRAEFRSGAD